PAFQDEYVAWSSETLRTSAHFETTQKPGPSRSGWNATGASARRRRNVSTGIPCTKVSGFVRSARPTGSGGRTSGDPIEAERVPARDLLARRLPQVRPRAQVLR